jgi:hypothetical protein
MRKSLTTFAAIGLGLLAWAATGCDTDDNSTPGNRTNQTMDGAGRRTDRAMDRAGDKAGNAVDRANTNMQNGADRAGNAMDRAADKTGNAIDNAQDRARDNMTPATQPSTNPSDQTMPR